MFTQKGYRLTGTYISFSKKKKKKTHTYRDAFVLGLPQVSQHLNYIADHLGIFMERLIQSNQVGQCSLSRQKKVGQYCSSIDKWKILVAYRFTCTENVTSSLDKKSNCKIQKFSQNVEMVNHDRSHIHFIRFNHIMLSRRQWKFWKMPTFFTIVDIICYHFHMNLLLNLLLL